ncbi:MAG: leucyl aminopeptidase family protein [Planctomycetota bacterium]
MTQLHFSSSLNSALRGAQHVALFASQAALKGGVWKHVFPAGAQPLVSKLVEDAEPGALGKVASTYTGGAPRRISVAALPNSLSRHLSPSRAVAIEGACGKLELDKTEKVTLVLCLDDSAHYTAAANALGRCFPLYHRRSKAPTKRAVTVIAVDAKGKALKAPAEVERTVEATRWAARLVDTPTAELSPADFVSEVKKALRGAKGVKVKTIEGKKLLDAKLGGIHGVGRAGPVPPRLLVLEAGPAKAKRTVAMVGKGVVYDTGGLSIKVGGNMSGMKTDMGGGAAVAGAFLVLVKEKLKDTRLVALVPLAENAVGPDSYRNDDVLDMHSGKTVEINNTDAEGRLLLADGVSYAARVCKADVVIDAATLTGAQLMSTGKRHAAVVSNRGGLEALAIEAGLASGDEVAPLPFAPELYQSEFASAVADMRNSVKDRMNAQSSCAAQFVYSHIQELDLPWLHVDLAGPSMPGKRGSGYGVALLAEVVRSLSPGALKS